jgi:protein TonB
MFDDTLASRLYPRRAPALGVSMATHAIVGIAVVGMASLPGSLASLDISPAPPRSGLVWIPVVGSAGGGGGGGERTPFASAAQLPGRDRLTVLAAAGTSSQSTSPPPSISINARPMADAIATAPGVIDDAPTITGMRGPGSGDGSGSGKGLGSGDGDGSGLGPGFGRGEGGLWPGPGSGVTLPEVIQQVKPAYTADAMRARIQGSVLIECVVLPDGTIGEIRIIRSLDKQFGLDEQAVKAARLWRFIPGRRRGEAVATVISIELTFTLR